ncbi:MAG: DUF3365 domain-containing protein [Candidatus Thiodiazotropha sp. (ex Monitilora ramsayi)]|nr:DUF3365 domain-containing protein [Candidatus Thiodiazotropha sp. (ex Monitilora ramsayi)]
MMIRLLQTRYYWLVPLIFWLFVAGVSLLWNLNRLEQSISEMAMERGRIMYEMVRQTKINPRIMATDPTIFKRQAIKNIGYRVVSSAPKNEENQADRWEAAVLSGFTREDDFAFKEALYGGEEVFRYIGPVFVDNICLTCHGGEQVKVGDLRGGISVVVKSQPIYDSQHNARQMMIFMHLAGFVVLSLTAIFFMRQLREQWLLLTDTRDELIEKEKFLSDITNAMGEGFLVLDMEGAVTYANPECERLLGWRADEMVGEKLIDLVCHEEGLDISQHPIMQTLQDGMIRRENDHIFLDKDGGKLPVAFSVSPMYEDEDLRGVVINFDDISERKAHEMEKSQLERELNQTHKMEAVGQLAGGIAHEINTPIQYVGDNLRFLKEAYGDIQDLLKVYGELQEKAVNNDELKEKANEISDAVEEADLDYLDEEVPRALDQSITGTEQVARIVLAMKEFAHPGTKSRALEDINRLINNAVAVSKNEWKYVADTSLKLEPDLPQVECMGGEISQVLLNLIINAAHAIKSADLETKGLISITSGQVGDTVEIRIKDNGTGIPASVRDSVFNPFFTTKDVGKGTGQGLAIAQDIVAVKHQGELFFETEEGVGTTFVIRLPLNRSESAPEA